VKEKVREKEKENKKEKEMKKEKEKGKVEDKENGKQSNGKSNEELIYLNEVYSKVSSEALKKAPLSHSTYSEEEEG